MIGKSLKETDHVRINSPHRYSSFHKLICIIAVELWTEVVRKTNCILLNQLNRNAITGLFNHKMKTLKTKRG